MPCKGKKMKGSAKKALKATLAKSAGKFKY